jgi:hypothetical protein
MNNPTGATADCRTTPHISIVITTYNSEDFLAQTLDSVLAQTLERLGARHLRRWFP